MTGHITTCEKSAFRYCDCTIGVDRVAAILADHCELGCTFVAESDLAG